MSSVSNGAAVEAVYTTVAIAVAAAALVGARAQHAVAAPPVQHIVVPPPVEDVPPPSDAAVLRVCADPNNLPFTNARLEGFENRIAEIVAADLGRKLEYYWQPQRRGFIRTTLNARFCDAVMGVPARFELAYPTHPYYRSSYVFVFRRDRRLGLSSLDDPRLARLRIGIQITGEDYENPPAAQALAERHLVSNVRGYTVYGDYSQADPQRQIVDAVAAGNVDTAIVWGPQAGFFAASARVPLEIRPVAPSGGVATLPFAFDIAMAVRRDDRRLWTELNGVIERRQPAIRRILEQYHVPMVARES